MIVKGTTKTGFEYEVETDVFNNMRVLDGLRELDKLNGNPFIWSNTAITILGREQYNALEAHIESLKGVADLKSFRDEFIDIMMGNLDIKK